MTVLMLGKYLELGLYRAEYLRSHGYHVLFPQSRAEAIAIVSGGAYDIVILSYSLSDEDAIELHELIEQTCPNCPVITLTEQRWQDTKIYSDKVVLVSEGPEALLEAVRSFESRGLEAKGLRRVK
jgi:CheY-like chemotaxis protein